MFNRLGDIAFMVLCVCVVASVGVSVLGYNSLIGVVSVIMGCGGMLVGSSVSVSV